MAKSLSDRLAARGVRATLAAIVVLAGLASGQALAADAQVKIANFTFDPPTLTVNVPGNRTVGSNYTVSASVCEAYRSDAH